MSDGIEKAVRGGGLAEAFRRVAVGSAGLLAEADGPRIAVLSYDGWDTHVREGAENGRLARLLGALDAALGGLAEKLAPVWRDTVVAVVTEFGARPGPTERMVRTTGPRPRPS
jgi:uncharacterized protein (DUF1501 family)